VGFLLVKNAIDILVKICYNYCIGDKHMNAEYTLTQLKSWCKLQSNDEQIWINKGTTYHWNRGKDTASGLINGVVRKLAGTDANGTKIWVVAGSIKIDPSGEILRWTGLPRKIQKTFESMVQEIIVTETTEETV
jgi:hypothetical protein